MSKVIDQDQFTRVPFDLLDETFETHHGIYLDEGTSLLRRWEPSVPHKLLARWGASARRWRRK